jgi:hypothetical protein
MKGEQWIKLPRELLESRAFDSLGINGFRVLRFLMLEQMRQGGRENGNLKAPRRQLMASGIGAHQVTAAIWEAEEHGLIECHRHGLRIATTYGLTWLPLHDGSPPGNEWQRYEPPAKRPARKRKNLPVKQQAGLPVKQQADSPNLPVNQQAVPSENLPVKQQALSRKLYQGGGVVSVSEGQEQVGKQVGTGSPCRFYVIGNIGYRICGMPSMAGADYCPEHTRTPQPTPVPAGKPNGAAPC